MPTSMDHPNHQKLAQFIEGRLSDRDSAIVESHITHCDDCTRFLDDFQSNDQFVKLVTDSIPEYIGGQTEFGTSVLHEKSRFETVGSALTDTVRSVELVLDVNIENIIDRINKSQLLPNVPVQSLCEQSQGNVGQLLSLLKETYDLSNYQIDCLKSGQIEHLVVGKYQIHDFIGSGGMGQVYLATHTGTILDTDLYDEKSYYVLNAEDLKLPAAKSIGEDLQTPETRVSMPTYLKNFLSLDGLWYKKENLF